MKRVAICFCSTVIAVAILLVCVRATIGVLRWDWWGQVVDQRSIVLEDIATSVILDKVCFFADCSARIRVIDGTGKVVSARVYNDTDYYPQSLMLHHEGQSLYIGFCDGYTPGRVDVWNPTVKRIEGDGFEFSDLQRRIMISACLKADRK
jgi:hypothetical protein